MTPQREEAEHFLRLARRDQAAFAALLNAPAVDPAVACFHAQQAAEKELKAVMCMHGLEYRRTHGLEELADTLADVGSRPPIDEVYLRCLTPYAVEFRYDDETTHLISGDDAGRLIALLLAWVAAEIARNGDTN